MNTSFEKTHGKFFMVPYTALTSGNFTDSEVLLLSFMVTFFNNTGEKVIHPSYEFIQESFGWNKQKVQRTMKGLTKKGALIVVGGGIQGRAREYKLGDFTTTPVVEIETKVEAAYELTRKEWDALLVNPSEGFETIEELVVEEQAFEIIETTTPTETSVSYAEVVDTARTFLKNHYMELDKDQASFGDILHFCSNHVALRRSQNNVALLASLIINTCQDNQINNPTYKQILVEVLEQDFLG